MNEREAAAHAASLLELARCAPDSSCAIFAQYSETDLAAKLLHYEPDIYSHGASGRLCLNADTLIQLLRRDSHETA